MNIQTVYPVIVNGKLSNRLNQKYSGIDASSNPVSISSFQKWYNTNKGGALTVDGKWGPQTSGAWSSSGTDYDTAMRNAASSAGMMAGDIFGMNPASSGTSSASNSSSGSSSGKKQKKGGAFFDKLKNVAQKAKDLGIGDSAKNLFNKNKNQSGVGTPASVDPTGNMVDTPSYDTPKPRMSIGVKIGIGVGIALVIGVIIYAVSHKKPATK